MKVGSEQKDIETQEQYLSSISEDEKEEQKVNEEYEQIPYVIEKFFFLIAYIVDCLLLLVIPIYIFMFGFMFLWKERNVPISMILRILWMIIVTGSILYCFVNYFFLHSENSHTALLVKDCNYFYLSSLLVFAYLMANYYDVYNFKDAYTNMEFSKTLCTFQYISKIDSDIKAYFLDYQSYEIKDEIKEYSQQQITISRNYNTLQLQSKSLKIIHEQDSLYSNFFHYIEPNFCHFLLLLLIIIIKIYTAFHYINIFSDHLTKKDIFDSVILIFIYIYTTFNLNRILGNNDLKRKSMTMEQIQSFIDFSDVHKQNNFSSKLDITCPISIETWDNARKLILQYQREYLQGLEVSYFCLIFYYLFVILIIVSAYFDLNWIIPKESSLLSPIQVIVSTFNFVFLSTFLLLRINEGQKFNDTFNGHTQCLVYLIDIMEDLLTIYDSLFIDKNRELKGLVKVERQQIYGVLIKKFKRTSNYYINQEIVYQDKIYLTTEKNNLRRKMIKNAKLSLEKVKKQIESDSLSLKYMFLNIIEIKFSDFLFTLFFSLVTTLPTIIPKFLDYFDKK